MSFTVESPVGTLTPTLGAATTINRAFGNYMDALRYVQAYDHSAYVVIVAAGLEKKPADVEQQVFAAGLVNLTDPVTLFIQSLLRGGKDPRQDEPKGETSGKP